MKTIKRLSIRTQVLLFGLFIIALIPVIISRVYQLSSETIINQNTQYNTELVSLLKERISANYANISSMMMNVGYDSTVQKFLLEKDKLRVYDLSQKVEGLLSIARNMNTDILDIVVTGSSNTRVSIAGRTKYVEDLMDTAGDDGIVQYRGYSPPDKILDKSKLLFGMNIFASGDTSKYGEKIGYLAVIMDMRAIQTEFSEYPRLAGTSFFMIDDKGVIYSNSNEPEAMLEPILNRAAYEDGKSTVETINGKKYAIQSFQLPEISGRIVTAVPVHSLMKELEKLKKFSIWLLALTLLVVSIPYSVLVMNLLRPLSRLMRYMNQLKAGSLQVLNNKVDLRGYAEMEIISRQFNDMTTRIHDLTGQLVDASTQLYQSDLEKQRAEYSYLQSQINPHFLSNTLDTIKGVAIVKGNREIFEMTTALSTMLRYSIKGKEEVTLGEELKIAEACVKIYQGRFPDKFTYTLFCPQEWLHISVPKMILQPIIENALAHGLEAQGSGVLLISVETSEEGLLEIAVEDNGVGIPADRLEQLTKLLAQKNIESGDHIGLLNVNNRLHLKYGDPCGVRLYSREGSGTKTVLMLPGTLIEPQEYGA
ncbi:sensor histidine kinase [Paenibacillus vini]|uniref:histidine kinase n=1 Tax=Paenibacillus vini TaxID=1476024 RepID=A0ABQ4MEC8_9BACL|nr:sensor histidine kinase [Paenibacillus vini]GIP54346.1 histidine kinase [Paenibacillus vini]